MERDTALEIEAVGLLTDRLNAAVQEVVKVYGKLPVNVNLVIFAAMARTLCGIGAIISEMTADPPNLIVQDAIKTIQLMCDALIKEAGENVRYH